jgi:alpha-tubulin suppressor-like RCC1 family protein
MKITTTKQVSTTIEVELPIYRKSPAFVYKVYCDNKCICICTMKNQEEIALRSASLAFSNEESIDITEQEFTTIYNEVFTTLNDLLI